MSRRIRLVVLALACAVAVARAAAAQDTVSVTVVVDTNVAVPMRDGVILRADIWRPEGSARFPTLVYRTPYGKHQATAAFTTARKAVARGYAVVLQDVRGRYASDGEFLPYQQEGRDGFDTIEWAAAQPWSNGDVGTFGLSYPGAVQWLAAIESPPHLKAMVPAMTFASPMQFWYSGGVWDMSWIGWIQANVAPDRRRRLGIPEEPRVDGAREVRPLLALSTLERVAPWYYEWLRHPAFDPWWDWAELRGKYGRTNAAVLNFSGWHDEAYGPHGATTNYAGLVSARSARGRTDSRTALIMGPWQHGVPRMTRTATGARVYGPEGVVDYDEIVLRWLDRHVRGIDNGADRARPVRVFVMGSNRWIEADGWPIPGVVPETLTFQRRGASTTILSDPSRPVMDPFADSVGARDYRSLAGRGDIVTFETAPLAEDRTVVGAIRAELSISADAPDTDIWVKVYDVAPDGTALNLMSPGLDVVRASYRNARPQRELLQPGRIYQLSLGDLLTANTFRKGHRIRVSVMTSFAPNFSRNLHTGELEVSSAASRTARVTIHHGPRYPFRVILPVLPASAMLSGK